MTTRGLSYTIESRPVSDAQTPRAHAVTLCASCEQETAVALPRAKHNPEAIGEHFRRLGFEFNPFKRASVRCPSCVARSRAVRSASAPSPSPSNSNTVIPMTQRPTLVTSPPQLPGQGGASPSVSAEQRAKVRDLLTGTFDEKRGHYLDHYSDQRVATECGVPMLVVREMREMWLGPIKSVPELEGIASEIRHLKDLADAFQVKADALKLRLDGEMQRLGVPS